MRIGHGYDVHRFAPDRDLILSGVKIPFELGLLGHSDADVLLHAVADSLLGAAALGDIGKHFPDTDPEYAGADSMVLLQQVVEMIREKGFSVGNVDVTVLAQRPKLSGYLLPMRQNLARVLGVSLDRVSIKATTEEGLGFTGNMEGMACHAVCLLNE